jgi:hypothetical protein
MLETQQRKAKICLYDLETAPSLGYIWDKYETNVLWYVKQGYLLSYAYKWLGDNKTYVVSLPDFKTYKKDPENDKELVQSLYRLFESAEVLVAHNGDSFDERTANGRFFFHHLTPPPPHKRIDTLKISRKYFKIQSHKLDDLGDYLGVGRKERTGGIDLWRDVLDGDMKAWKKMCKYNRMDVILLERIYLHLRPWAENHPAINLIENNVKACPKCGACELVARGTRYNKTTIYQRYRCKACGGWCNSRTPVKLPKVEFVS